MWKEDLQLLKSRKVLKKKGKIDWAAIFEDLSKNSEFLSVIASSRNGQNANLLMRRDELREVWQKNLVQNSSKSPPGGAEKYHMCLLYWMHLPRHQTWKTAELNRIANDLCSEIFQMSATEKIAQMRATKHAIQRSPTGSRPITAEETRSVIAESDELKYPGLHPTYAQILKHSDAYQRTRNEFQLVKDAFLISSKISKPSIIAIYGAGGYGKSALAQELCDDPEIQARFPGGIYWLQFGLTDSRNESAGYIQLSQTIDRMLAGQYSFAERPSLVWENQESDITTLLSVLPKAPLLLVADDLWTERQSSWLSKTEGHASVLITTRRWSIAGRASHQFPIKRLPDDASYKLLTHSMSNILPNQQQRFQEVATRFKGWPLLLNLGNGVFKQLSGNLSARIENSLREYEQFLVDDQIDGWDIEEAGKEALEKRRKLVGLCIETGLNAIHLNNNPDLLRSLAVFPDDADIPFQVVIDFWNRTAEKKVSNTRGWSLLRHFNDFSFFSSFNENTQFLKLHDEILSYFRASLDEEKRRSLQRELLASIQARCKDSWETLPQDHRYGWTRLLYHLEKAELTDDADNLRTNFQWLKAKLAAVGVSELQRSFLPMPSRNDARLVGRAINLSISTLGARPISLAHQLFGRLGHESDARVQELVETARSDPSCWPIPVRPHLSCLGRELLRFVGHCDEVNTAAFDRSGQKVVTASDDGTARLWEAKTGAQICKPLKHLDRVCCAAFDPSGQKVVTTSNDGIVRLWCAETGAIIGEPLKHRTWVRHAAFDTVGQKVMTVSTDGSARLWNADTGALISKPIKGHQNWSGNAVFDPSGRKVVIISRDGTHLWNAETRTQIGAALEGHSKWIRNAAFDASGQKLVTTSDDNTARLWNAETGAPIGEPLEGHHSGVCSAAFDSSGSKIVTASDDGTARLWNAETGAPIGEPLEGHQGEVRSAVFDPSGRKILTASDDGTARLWNAETGAPIGEALEGHHGKVHCAEFDPSGSRILTASEDGTVRLWDADMEPTISEPLEEPQDRVRSIAFNSSGKVMTISNDGNFQLWNAESGTQMGEIFEEHLGSVRTAAFDPSGRKFVTISFDSTARLWNAETGAQMGETLEEHLGSVRTAAFDPSGRKFVTMSPNGIARLWDAGTSSPIGGPLEIQHQWIGNIVFDPSGRKMVTISNDGTARLWDAETGAQIGKPLEGHHGKVRAASFDPSGTRIVTISDDDAVRLWDAETSARVGKLLGIYHDKVRNVTFDRSGVVVTISMDGIKLWDAQKGTLKGRAPEGYYDWVGSMIFEPNGRNVVTLSSSIARLWDAETGAPIADLLNGPYHRINSVIFDSSGRIVTAASDDGTVQIWDAKSGACMATVDFDEPLESVACNHNHLAVRLKSGLVCLFASKENG